MIYASGHHAHQKTHLHLGLRADNNAHRSLNSHFTRALQETQGIGSIWVSRLFECTFRLFLKIIYNREILRLPDHEYWSNFWDSFHGLKYRTSDAQTKDIEGFPEYFKRLWRIFKDLIKNRKVKSTSTCLIIVLMPQERD